MDLSEAVPTYLLLALRVKRNPERAQKGLAILGRRNDLSPRLKQDLATWRTSLMALAPELQKSPSLESARRILAEGRSLDDFPWQGGDIIHAIVASSLLFRYIDDRKPGGEDLAEALYLLARSNAFTGRSFELFEPQFFLEQAIFVAPHTEIASRAYAALEIEATLIYGASGALVPEDVREWLARLRELSEILPVEPIAGLLDPGPTLSSASPVMRPLRVAKRHARGVASHRRSRTAARELLGSDWRAPTRADRMQVRVVQTRGRARP
jgi:hypothetical protein